MTGVTGKFPFRIAVWVDRDGAIRLDGRVFWSTESLERAGHRVGMAIPAQDAQSVTATDDGGQRFQADLICDAGFRDSEIGRAAAAAERRRRDAVRSSVVGWQAKALVELIEQHVEDALIVERIVRRSPIAKAFDYLARLFIRAGALPPEHGHRRKLQIADRRKLALQKAAAIFEHAHALIEGHSHGSVSTCFDNPDANPELPGGASSK